MIMQPNRVTNRVGKPTPIYQLKVLLNGSQPPIWRRLQIPAAANLGWLHAVLQVAIGWTNSHLHDFICGEHSYADPRAELQEYEGDPSVLDETKFKVADLLHDIHERLVYKYDFGDSWEHVVILEAILPSDASKPGSAVCLAGSRACPPEDCGGIWGYMELLKALKNKKHPEHRRRQEWLGRPFDPESFGVAKVNKALQ